MSAKLKLLRDLKPDEKVAPQMKVIVEELKAVGIGKEIERDKLVERLEKNEKMVTRQPVSRILAYYSPHLREDGLVEFSKPEPKPAKPAAEKPAKPGAAPAEKPVKAPA